MDVAVAVRPADLRRIDMAEPVVGGDLAGDVEDQAAQRIALVGIGIDAPVAPFQVFIDGRGDIDLAARGGNCVCRHETSNKHNMRCFYEGYLLNVVRSKVACKRFAYP